MELLKLFLKDHKGLVVAAIAVLALVAAFSVARCTMVQSERALEAITDQADEPDGAGSAPTKGSQDGDGDDGQSEEQQAVEKLSDAQRERQDAYDDDQQAFVAELSANIWATGNDAYFLTFTQKTFTDHADGEVSVHPYVINTISPVSVTTENGVTIEIMEGAIETDEGAFVLTYTHRTSTETGAETVMITSDAFHAGKQDAYTRSAPVEREIAVTGLNDDFKELIDGDMDGLEKALRDFCSLSAPTTTEAAWRGVAEHDWAGETVTTWFDLDNSGENTLEVIYNTRTKQFSVENYYGAL